MPGTGTGRDARDFCLGARNLPDSLDDWKKVKDFCREFMTTQPGWTHLFEAYHVAFIKIKSQDQVQRVFDGFVREYGNTVLLELYDISAEHEEPVHVKTYPAHEKNLMQQFIKETAAHYQQSSTAPPAPPTPPTPSAYAFSTGAQTSHGAYNMAVAGYALPAYSPPTYQVAPVAYGCQMAGAYGPSASYQMNQDGLAVNVTEGTVPTERTTIHISSLKSSVRDADIEKLLSKKKLATPVKIDVRHPQEREDKKKAYALVEFRRPGDAQMAVQLLDGIAWPCKDRRLRVKWAKESRTPANHAQTAARAPVIVDGSGTTPYK